MILGALYGLVSAVVLVIGDDSTKSSADSTVTTSGATSPTSPEASGLDPTASSEAVATSIATTTTLADSNTVPTPEDPARVLLVGDSEAGGLSPFLERVLDDTGLVDMTTDYKSSTGLVRPDYFDWPARLREQVPGVAPDIVVALFGGNDGQAFPNTSDPVDSVEWRAEYAKRVAEVIDILSGDGRMLIWVGVPNGASDDLTDRLAVLNEVVKAEVGNHPGVVFVDAWDRFTGLDGGFAPYVIDPRDGEAKAVRSETDGFHLNTVGEEILAFDVGSAVIAALRERGASL